MGKGGLLPSHIGIGMGILLYITKIMLGWKWNMMNMEI